MNVMTDLIRSLEDHMKKTEEAMKADFAGIRTGKASSALVENINVEYYGTTVRIRELAGIMTPDARTIVIQPYDKTAISAIEKAIQASSLGISPGNDGNVIRLPIPELSEERRVALTKQVKSRAEDAKVAIRNIRRDGNEVAKKAQKNSEITEDQLKDILDGIQKLTDKFIVNIDADLAEKDKELLKI